MSNSIRWGAISITGDFREHNEDNYLADSDGRYFIVADGMGGHAAGEKASEMAVQLVSQKLDQLIDFSNSPSPDVIAAIDEAIDAANTEILALGKSDPDLNSMGTTIALLVAVGEYFYITGVGDSRVFVLQGEELTQLTKDDSLVQVLVDAGTISPEETLTHPYKHVLAQYLGRETQDAATGTQQFDRHSGDRFLLCSDGVTDGAADKVLALMLGMHDDPQKAAQAIVNAAQVGGSQDNITCLVLHVV